MALSSLCLAVHPCTHVWLYSPFPVCTIVPENRDPREGGCVLSNTLHDPRHCAAEGDNSNDDVTSLSSSSVHRKALLEHKGSGDGDRKLYLLHVSLQLHSGGSNWTLESWWWQITCNFTWLTTIHGNGHHFFYLLSSPVITEQRVYLLFVQLQLTWHPFNLQYVKSHFWHLSSNNFKLQSLCSWVPKKKVTKTNHHSESHCKLLEKTKRKPNNRRPGGPHILRLIKLLDSCYG